MEGVMEGEAAAKGLTRDDIHNGCASGTSRSLVTAEDIANMAVFLGLKRHVWCWQVIAVDCYREPDPGLGYCCRDAVPRDLA